MGCCVYLFHCCFFLCLNRHIENLQTNQKNDTFFSRDSARWRWCKRKTRIKGTLLWNHFTQQQQYLAIFIFWICFFSGFGSHFTHAKSNLHSTFPNSTNGNIFFGYLVCCHFGSTERFSDYSKCFKYRWFMSKIGLNFCCSLTKHVPITHCCQNVESYEMILADKFGR